MEEIKNFYRQFGKGLLLDIQFHASIMLVLFGAKKPLFWDGDANLFFYPIKYIPSIAESFDYLGSSFIYIFLSYNSQKFPDSQNARF